MRKITGLLSVLLILLFSSSASALITQDSKAPWFRTMDGNNQWLDSSTLKGKVVVGFYQSRDTLEKNAELESLLKKFYWDNIGYTRDKVFMLAVVDATPANFFTKSIWKNKLVKTSQERKVTIYGDWDGQMKTAFGFNGDDSTFIIIDKDGYVRYIYEGKVPQSQYQAILDQLKKLTAN